jgi:hypothetical protein
MFTARERDGSRILSNVVYRLFGVFLILAQYVVQPFSIKSRQSDVVRCYETYTF